MRRPKQTDIDDLEALVDAIGLYETVSLIAAICASKAMHIEESYDDTVLAKQWNEAGEIISEASDSEEVGIVSGLT